jgi:hypothetical protein
MFNDMSRYYMFHCLVANVLKKLDPTKANGPDQIPTRILKEAYNEIAPFLTIILRQSLITGELFEDWRQANITRFDVFPEVFTQAIIFAVFIMA